MEDLKKKKLKSLGNVYIYLKVRTVLFKAASKMGSTPCQKQWVKGSHVAAAAEEVVAVAQIQSPAQELPYAVGAAFK